MSEVLVRTKNCRYSKGSNIEVPDAYRATSSTGCYSKMHHGMDVMEGNAVYCIVLYCISYHDFLKHLNIANSVCWYMIASWLQQRQALYWASKLHSPRKKEGFNPEVDRAPTHIYVCVWGGGDIEQNSGQCTQVLECKKILKQPAVWAIRIRHATIQPFGIGEIFFIFLKEVSCSPRLHLFVQKDSQKP